MHNLGKAAHIPAFSGNVKGILLKVHRIHTYQVTADPPASLGMPNQISYEP